ncbi:MAG: ATP-binding protein, partial [Actinomycetota bacterium]
MALDAARAGHGGLVVIAGEAGMGKTHLLSVWTEHVRAGGATVLTGHCEEVTRDLPLQAVISAITDHLRAAGPGETERVLGPEAQVLAPFLGSSRTGASPQPLPTLRGSVVDHLVVFAALMRVLRRVPAPTVLVMDDAHFAGSATAEWIAYAAREAAAMPLLLVCAQRPEEAGTSSPEAAFAGAETVLLAPLDSAAAVEIVGAERAAELLLRSGGNPLLLVELAAADPAAELPRSIRDAVIARCERAGPAAAATLRAAALLG